MLIVSHVRGWRSLDRLTLEPVEAEYFSRQYWRRLATSTTIGLLGAMVISMHWVRSPLVFTGAILTLMLLVVVTLVLALIDFMSSRRFLQDLVVSQRVRRAELESEVERLRQSQPKSEGNGKETH